jgi:hypothetical protein
MSRDSLTPKTANPFSALLSALLWPKRYERVEVAVERFDSRSLEQAVALVYLKHESSIPPSAKRIGPLAEYKQEHAARFQWGGAA